MESTDSHNSPHDFRKRAGAIAGCLAQCLRHLDAIDEGLAAVHVSMALDILKRDFRLDPKE